MSVTKFKCAPGYLQQGKNIHEFEYCIEHCANRCTPVPVLQVMTKELRTNFHQGKYISASALSGCKRSVFLERTTEHHVEPKKQIWQSLRGTLSHAMFEESDADEDRYLNEVFYYYDFKITGSDGKKHTARLNGTFDRYDTKDRVLTDYKTMNDFGITYILENGAKEEHILQTNTYKFLLENGTHKPKNGQKKLGNFKVKEIKIVYLTMKTVAETGILIYEQTNSGRIIRHNIPEVPLIPKREILKFIIPNVTILNDAFERGVLPDPPDEDTQKWLCGTNFPNGAGYCQVKEHCDHWKELAEENGWIYNSNRRDV